MRELAFSAAGNLFPSIEGLKDFPYWDKPLIVQEKADGWFASAHTKVKGSARIFSAGSRELKNAQLLPTIQALGEYLPENTIVVGELGFGTAAETKWAADNGYHRFLPFDIVQTTVVGTVTTPDYRRRLELLENFKSTCTKEVAKFIHFPESLVLDSGSVATKMKKVMDFYEKVKGGNGEGLMIKCVDHRYRPEETSKFVWKMKKLVTKDYVLMGFTDTKAPTFLKQGMTVGAMVVGLYVDGELQEVTNTSAFDFEWRKKFSDNPKEYIGKVVELGGYQVFASGAMRHSSFLRFREDREPKDCVL